MESYVTVDTLASEASLFQGLFRILHYVAGTLGGVLFRGYPYQAVPLFTSIYTCIKVVCTAYMHLSISEQHALDTPLHNRHGS